VGRLRRVTTPEPLPVPAALASEYAPYFDSPRVGKAFRNPWPDDLDTSMSQVLRWKTQTNTSRPRSYRAQAIELPSAPLSDFEELAGAATRLFWIGHASFLMELDGTRFVIDPIFGRAGGFVPRVTPAAAPADALTGVAAVLVTHGHHDHFDRGALRALAQANGDAIRFVVPLGLAASLPRECVHVIEMGWWEYVEIEGVRVHMVPAQHWHRRGAFDLNKALWGGYVLTGTHSVYHSGDTGYFGGFAAMGKVFGGIDVACLPLGAYEPRWFMGAQHMSPEGSLDAQRDLCASHLLGMHWGAYDLSDEPLDAGPRLLRQTARERHLPAETLHVLRPGGSLALKGVTGQTRAHALHVWPQD